ncbi:AAA family ATPase [Halospina sp. K52047b]|nr:AAA family ATPase [Halospina sp. K52047b]
MTLDSSLQGHISKVTIRGFRSIENIENLHLGQLTVLIGANGSGKSNLMRFFEMLSYSLKAKNLQQFVLDKGGGDDQLFFGARRTPRMEAEIQLETEQGVNEYRMALTHVAPDTLAFSQEAFRFSRHDRNGHGKWVELPMPAQESSLPAAAADKNQSSQRTARTILYLLRNCTSYQFHDTSAKASLNMRWDESDAMRLRSDGGNLAPILLYLSQEHPRRYSLIKRQIQRVLPVFDDFQLEGTGGKVLLRWRASNSDKSFGPHLTSDGSLRLFCLFTLLNLPDEMLPDVLMIDEPELGLHPHAIALTAEMIKSVASQRQVFIATQSPLMVDAFDVENILVARLKEGATELTPMDKAEYQTWLEDDYQPSDLWLKEPVG